MPFSWPNGGRDETGDLTNSPPCSMTPGLLVIQEQSWRKDARRTSPDKGKVVRAGWWSRLDACQDYFFSVSQQDIDRLKASIREQTNPPHYRQPVPDAILIVRIAEETIIVAQ